MRIAIIIIVLNIIIILIDFLSYRAINESFNQILSKHILSKIVFFIPTILTLGFLAYAIIKTAMGGENIYTANLFYTVFGLFVLFFLPKLNLSIFYLLDSFVFFLAKKHLFINTIGLSVSVILFLFVAHGLSINRDNFQVRTQELTSTKIPSSFNGSKIIQISDLHIGSFHDRPQSIEKMVETINKENADIIVFTGDMVSNYAKELDEFVPVLQKLKANYGKFSILGNHDYGEYVSWKSKEEEHENLEHLKKMHQAAGFTLLNNENRNIEINGDAIQLVGIENWGLPPFPQYGKLAESIENIDENIFTILLSHDPSHWRAEVLNHSFIDLTLSGHTHAMQFGFEIGSWQWSPVSFKYKEWGGLYQDKNQYLYVNRGTGYIGLPGRVGIRPEITKIVLNSAK